MGGPYSLLRYSSGNSGIEIPVDFAASGTLTAVCGNAVLIEYTALMTGSLMAVVSGQHGMLHLHPTGHTAFCGIPSILAGISAFLSSRSARRS